MEDVTRENITHLIKDIFQKTASKIVIIGPWIRTSKETKKTSTEELQYGNYKGEQPRAGTTRGNYSTEELVCGNFKGELQHRRACVWEL